MENDIKILLTEGVEQSLSFQISYYSHVSMHESIRYKEIDNKRENSLIEIKFPIQQTLAVWTPHYNGHPDNTESSQIPGKANYSQTSSIRTPKGQIQVSALQRCPYYRGRKCVIFGISGIKWTVRKREVSVLQRCPQGEVRLYRRLTEINSCYYGPSLMLIMTPAQGPYSSATKGVDYIGKAKLKRFMMIRNNNVLH